MHTTKFLSLVVFSHEKAAGVVNVERALKGLGWAIQAVHRALQDPKSAEARCLRHLGYCAVILAGPGGDEYVRRFEDGNVVCIDPTGRDLEMIPAQPEGNGREALAWLEACLGYTQWVQRVLEAKQASSRPPVFDTAALGVVREEIRGWIGQEAEQYLADWKATAHERAAARARLVETSSLTA